MNAIDASVAVAALATWHDAHDVARAAAHGAAIPSHALLETYSVLTRLPAPHRLHRDVAGRLLERWFPAAGIVVPTDGLARGMVERCRAAEVEGGALYDALIGLTADEAGLPLLTRDRRAISTYERLGIGFVILE